MDENLGRETARHLGRCFIGIIGVLIEARHNGLISTIKPYLDALRYQAGFRVSNILYTRVLRDAGEM